MGVALTKEVCLLCYKEVDGPIVMNTVLTEKNAKQVEELQGKSIGYANEPCSECKHRMTQGFILLGIDEEKTDFNNLPGGFFRTGQYVVLRKESNFVQHLKETRPEIYKSGFTFIDQRALVKMGIIDESKLLDTDNPQ